MKSVGLRIAFVVLFSLAVYHPGQASETDQPQKIMIFPPVLHGPADMAYLRQGLVDMISTRLADPGKVVIVAPDAAMVARGPIDKATAIAGARQAGAQQVVIGSLTILGSNISTDLRMVDVASETLTIAFSESGDDPSALIEHANLFAAQANQKVFARAEKEKIAVQRKPEPAKTPAAPENQIYQHPEKLLQQPMVVGEGRQYGEDGGIVLIGAASALRGPRINGQVQSLAVGDVDGDGSLEAVIAGISKLWVYKYANGRFAKMAELKGSGNYIGVDLADVNENGREEIFVTNFDNENGRVSSFVMEYDGRKFKRTHELLDLYFRAINVPMRGRVLFGQRQGLEDLFLPGIYEIVWKDGKYRRGPTLKAPRKQNIFGMGLGSMPPSQDQMIFAYDSSHQLQITDAAGREEWISSSGFGSSAALVETRTTDDLSGSDYHYLQGRIEVIDLDGDGAEEAVVLRNEDVTGSFAKRTRVFRRGRIEVLKKDELGMNALMRTRYLPKYISDFAVRDMDQDGKPEILTAVVQKTENITSSGRTNIFLFKLDGLSTRQEEDQ